MYQQNLLKPVLMGIIVSCLLYSGCGPSADLTMNFTPDNTTRYEVTQTMIKDFKFEQPTLNKKKEDETSTKLVFVFDQQIQSVDEQGWAVAKVTIDQLKCKTIKTNDVEIDFDSTLETAKTNPLYKLIGQSYTIRLSPDGQAELLEASGMNVNAIAGLEGQIAKSLFKSEEVAKRHQVLALPPEAESLSKGKTWARTVDSPRELLAPKTYQKNYTLTDIEMRDNTEVAHIHMKAEALPAAPGIQSGGLGIFANIMDNEDEYSGSMELDLSSGQVLHYQEELISAYLAQEVKKPDQAPDTLVIRFIQRIERKQLD